jgi:hypothetical protein
MSKGYYDVHVRDLVFRRGLLPTDAAERRDLQASIRYLYRRQTDSSFRAFLFLVDCAAKVGRALGWILTAIGLNELRDKIVRRLRGD